MENIYDKTASYLEKHASVHKTKTFSLLKRRALLGLLLVSPVFIFLGIFVYRPLAETIYLSFFEWNMMGERTPIGVANYIELFESIAMQQAAINTVLYAIWLIALIIILPIIAIAGMMYIGKRLGYFYRTVLFLPTVVSLSITSIIWVWVFNPIGGLLSIIWENLGLDPVNWLFAPATALVSIVIIVAWKAFGYNMILLFAATSSISKELIEAAKIDGTSEIKLWWYIILPLIAPTIFFVMIFTMTMAAEYVFTPIHILTGGGPVDATTNLVFEIWRQAFSWFRVGLSATTATVVLIIFAILLAIKLFISERLISYEKR